jgi:hypothetical protein
MSWRRIAIGALVVLVILAGTGYVFRKSLILYFLATVARDMTPVAANREIVWNKGPETAPVEPAKRPPNIVVILADDLLEDAVEAIVSVTQSGEIGDGKIFISDVLDAVRIRTGERGSAALT